MLNWLVKFKEKMISHYSMTLLLVGCVTGLSAAWLGWGVIGVFLLGMAFAKTAALPECPQVSSFSVWPSQLLSRSHLKQTMPQDLEYGNKQNPDCVL